MQTPRTIPETAYRYRARLTTRWSDEDNQAVLNNAVYLTLLEEARLRYFRDLDLLVDGSFPFVLGQSNVRFTAPGRGGAEVEVAVATVRLGNRSFEQVYRVADVGSGTVWCEAEALLVAWDPETRGSRPMDATFLERVATFEGLE